MLRGGALTAALPTALVPATVTAPNVPLALVGQRSRYAGLLSYLVFLAAFLVPGAALRSAHGG